MMADPQTPIQEGLARVRASLPEAVTIVAVTKGRTPAQIREATLFGYNEASASCTVGSACLCRDLGENRVDEAAEKITLFGDVAGLRWHMIGHLQRNKARDAAALFHMVQSVDSLRLAEALERHCAALGRRLPVLIEVNIGREEQKHGVPPEEALSLAREVIGLPHLKLSGLMAMAPFLPAEQTRPYFRRMAALFRDIRAATPTSDFTVLSMGMSEDYRIAVEEGSTMVRIGRAIFEPQEK